MARLKWTNVSLLLIGLSISTALGVAIGTVETKLTSAAPSFDQGALHQMLVDVYKERRVNADPTDDFPFKEQTPEQRTKGVMVNGRAIAGAFYTGALDGEISHQARHCPTAVVGVIDPSFINLEREVDIAKCRARLAEMKGCIAPLDVFVSSPGPCLMSLDTAGRIFLQTAAVKCSSDPESASCLAYNRFSAKLTYLMRAVGERT